MAKPCPLFYVLRFTFYVSPLHPRQRKRKHRPALFLIRRPDAPTVFLDDPLADRKAQARALGLAIGRKRLEEPVDDFGRNALAGVGNLGQDFVLVEPRAD